MNPLLLAPQASESVDDEAASFGSVTLSRTDVVINHWIDIAIIWLDRYMFTPLLGPNQTTVR